MKLIGIGGYPKTGKSAAAAMLVKDGWTAVGFSDAIVTITEAMVKRLRGECPLDHDRDRDLLQELGHVAREAISDNVWILAVERKIKAAPGPVVVSGVRFPNEVKMIRRLGGMYVRVRRPGCGPGRVNLHKMETSLDDVIPDRWIDNSRGLDWLAAQVRSLAQIA